MNNNFKWLPLFIGLSLAGSAFSQTDDWNTFEYGKFTIEHPADWEHSIGKSGTEFILYSPLDDEEDMFLDAIALRLMEADGDLENQVLNFQMYVLSQGYEVIANERKNAAGKSFHFIEYKGMQGEQELHYLQYQWHIGEEDVQLNFVGEATKIIQHRELALKIMDTFRHN